MSIPVKGLIFHGAASASTSILSGNVDPTTEGGPGDFYVRLDTGELFGPKHPSTGWPSTSIDLTGIADGAVVTVKIADDAVTQAKIADDAVGSDQIAADAVGSSEIASGAVGTSELASSVSSQLLPSGGTSDYGKAVVYTPSGYGLFTPQISGVSGLQSALDGKADLEGGKLKASQVPAIAITDVYTVASQAASDALTLQTGDVVIRSDQNKSYIHNGTELVELKTPTDAVLSVNGQTGAVTLDHTDVGAAAASHTHSLADITDAGTAAASDTGDFAAAEHTHDLGDITDAGTAASKNVPASGDASSTEVVLGSDSRLSDQRTPSDGSVTTAKIADSAVTSAKLNDGAVSSGKLASAVSSQLIPSGGSTGQALVKGASGYEWSTIATETARQSLEQSVTVAAGSEVSIDMSMAKSFAVTKIVASKPCRFRLYNTAASRTADTSRVSTSPPAADSGLIMEAIFTSDLLSLPVFPAQIGQNQESTPSSTMKALVRNDGDSADLTLTVSYLPLEA